MTDEPDWRRPQSEALLAAVVDSSWDAIISKTLTGTIISWNKAAERMFGLSAEEMVGESIRKIIPEASQAEEDTIIERIAGGRSVAAFQTQRLHKDGRLIPVSITVSPVRDEHGVVIGASKIARALDDESALAAQLRESDLRFRTLADNIPQLAWMADGKGYIYWYNRRWYDFTGTTLQQMKGWGWKAVHHPDHVDRVVARIQHSWDTGVEWEDTFPLRGADGHYRWFLSRAKPIRDVDGQVICWFGTNTDITEERAQQEQIRLLMREVNHRSKNMLAMIQSLARRTVPDGNSEFVERFEQRIQALAANQDLLMNRQWRFAEMKQIAQAQLYMVEDLLGERIRLTGPEMMIKPAPAETIGLALHELATNAAKYGALSNDSGTVDIRWGLGTGTGDVPSMWIEWQERGGPTVVPPAREGFGSTVIQRMPQLSIGAHIDMRYEPEGVFWRLTGNGATILHGQPETHVPGTTQLKSEDVGIGPVLLVEDEPIVALDLLAELNRHGYWVLGPASRLEAAQTMIDRQPPACVLLDVQLGDQQTTAGLAEQLTKRGIPFIVLSGFQPDELPSAFAGAPVLHKPVQFSELKNHLERLLPRKPTS